MTKISISKLLDKTLCRMCYASVVGKKKCYFICIKSNCTERRKLHHYLKTGGVR